MQVGRDACTMGCNLQLVRIRLTSSEIDFFLNKGGNQSQFTLTAMPHKHFPAIRKTVNEFSNRIHIFQRFPASPFHYSTFVNIIRNYQIPIIIRSLCYRSNPFIFILIQLLDRRSDLTWKKALAEFAFRCNPIQNFHCDRAFPKQKFSLREEMSDTVNHHRDNIQAQFICKEECSLVEPEN